MKGNDRRCNSQDREDRGRGGAEAGVHDRCGGAAVGLPRSVYQSRRRSELQGDNLLNRRPTKRTGKKYMQASDGSFENKSVRTNDSLT